MASRQLDKDNLGVDEDWIGNGAAFRCPVCTKVFIVSAFLHRKGRRCPACAGSRAVVTAGTARIEG